jgi:midasin (ATPase involved in ribosome maturation)
MPVTPSQLQTILAAMIPARLPLLSTGSPGIGKSDIIAQLANTA